MPLFKKKGKLSKAEQSLARLENFKKEITTDCHIIPLDELCVRLNTDPVTGLTPAQAKQIFMKTGPNSLTPSKKKPEILVFLATLFHGFSLLLWFGALLCFASVGVNYISVKKIDHNNIMLGVVLIVVVILTGMFMYYQDRKSKGIMDSFANMVPAKANVVRGGVTTEILSRELVLGDLVEVKFGDRIPADLRIIHSQSLKVDNSPITGESEPQSRGTTCTDENFLETKNVAFFSTNVIEGIGKGIVIGCGDHTVMGHIAGLTARLKPNKTPMAKELDRFMKIVSIWACSLGIVLGITCLILGHSVLDTLLFSIGIIVANVPEGLLATVIVCLTVTAKKMAAKNCLIKHLESVETLGSTSIICSDKTGTLTQNKMTVVHIWYSNKVQESDVSESQKSAPYKSDKSFKILMRCASLCNRAEFLAGEEEKPILQRKVRGDASEEAILKFAEISNVHGANYRTRNPKLVEIPFSSATKLQLSIHALEDDTCLLVMKGAPEVILDRCNKIYFQNETKEMSREMLDMCNKACLQFAEMGERVLGFCDLVLESRFTKDFKFSVEPANFPQRGLRFLGLLAMIDPARPEVPDAIRKCKAAGIKVAMVTGDHPITGKAIAIKVGIITNKYIIDLMNIKQFRKRMSMASDPGALVIHGAVLRHLLQDELDTLLFSHTEIVFARTSPTQKLQIVESYQRLGEIVAVTGDGVNDAPALKKADIGIAMGIAGTEVSQQAADIILMDDNFASIILGIEEGRKIFDNLKKSITYTLTSNVPEIFPFLIYSFLNIPLPLGVIAILSIDLLTDMMPAISLAYEKAESDIMSRPPRNPMRDKLVSRKLYFLAYGHLGMIEAAGGFYSYFILMSQHGFYPETILGIRSKWESANATVNDSYGREWNFHDRNVLIHTSNSSFLVAIVIMQWANLIACKTRFNSIRDQGMGNMILNISLVVETIFALILTYVPYMYYLQFSPISYDMWLYPLPFAALLLLFDEARKWHIRKYPRGWYQRETSY